MEDNRSKKFVFIPFCLICQAFQAKGIVKYEWSSSIKPIISLLIEKDYNIVQMPCPESTFKGYAEGLSRKPKGYNYYNNPDFKNVCSDAVMEVIKKIKGILNNGYEISAIFGIEMSPSCAVNYQYTNKGMINKPGLFIEMLQNSLKEERINIKFIGINRRHINPALKEISLLK